MDQTYMKQKPVLPLVVSMALPMTLSMFVNSLYNIVDSIFIAKISDNAMTALSLVYPIQNLIMAITVGFAIGTNAVISIHLGCITFNCILSYGVNDFLAICKFRQIGEAVSPVAKCICFYSLVSICLPSAKMIDDMLSGRCHPDCLRPPRSLVPLRDVTAVV